MKAMTAFLLLWMFAGMHLPACSGQKIKPPGPGKQPTPTTKPANMETSGTIEGIKDLAAGTHCPVFESFVLVARDQQTYAALKNLNVILKGSAFRKPNVVLPDDDPDFFKSHAVVAAFLGQRRTGGFAVNITRLADGVIQVSEQKPKGMVTMALTTPFRIVAVPIGPDDSINLSLDETWQDRLRTYQVTSGELTITGGFAGIRETSTLSGTLQIMRAAGAQSTSEGMSRSDDSLVTVLFAVKSSGKRQTELRNVASGVVARSGAVLIANFDSYRFSGALESPFRATGQFSKEEAGLSLELQTVPSPHVADNCSAAASLQATATTPPPANRALTGDP